LLLFQGYDNLIILFHFKEVNPFVVYLLTLEH